MKLGTWKFGSQPDDARSGLSRALGSRERDAPAGVLLVSLRLTGRTRYTGTCTRAHSEVGCSALYTV